MKLKNKRKLLLIIFLLFSFIYTIHSYATSNDFEVYITKTGSKFHTLGCSYLRSSSYEISLSDAIKRGYDPCSRCKAYSVYREYIDTKNTNESNSNKQQIKKAINETIKTGSQETSAGLVFKSLTLLTLAYCSIPVILKLLKIEFSKEQLIKLITINNIIQFIIIHIIATNSYLDSFLFTILFGIIEYLLVGGKLVKRSY